MARKKKEEMVAETADKQVEETATSEENETSNPTEKTESPFVTLGDVAEHKDEGKVQIIPITDSKTKLSKITIFDDVENADDSLTYRIQKMKALISL